MGLHSGLASPNRGNYVALAVHQAARVVSAAHGGQVIASSTVVGAAALPDGAAFTPLGRFRLRDFDEPQLLHQLTAPGLAADFPAVRAVPADGHNIVRPQGSFVGREADLAGASAALDPGRVVTLLGPGGVGRAAWRPRSASGWPPTGAEGCGWSRWTRCRSRRCCRAPSRTPSASPPPPPTSGRCSRPTPLRPGAARPRRVRAPRRSLRRSCRPTPGDARRRCPCHEPGAAARPRRAAVARRAAGGGGPGTAHEPAELLFLDRARDNPARIPARPVGPRGDHGDLPSPGRPAACHRDGGGAHCGPGPRRDPARPGPPVPPAAERQPRGCSPAADAYRPARLELPPARSDSQVVLCRLAVFGAGFTLDAAEAAASAAPLRGWTPIR